MINTFAKYFSLLAAGSCICISSCKNEASDIGSSFFNSHSNVIVVDTITAQMETVYLDSIATSGTGVILLGGYEDSLCGNARASSYMQLGAPSNQLITATDVYDSLCFLLKPNRYASGDTMQYFSFSVHALTSLIAPSADESDLYNTSSFPYDPAPLGTWTGKIYPARTDSLSVRLSDQLGQRLFSAIVNQPEDLATDNLFTQNYLKGIVLTSEKSSTVYGFTAGDSSALIRLYYHDVSHARTTLHTDFRITDRDLQFNRVVTDRSGTPLHDLDSRNGAVNADTTNQFSAMQPLSNLAIRLRFPYIKNLLHLGRYVQMMSAQLALRPRAGTYSAGMPLPPAVSVCVTQNDNYNVLDSLTDANGTEHGNLVTGYAYNNTYYTYDITQYLNTEIQVANNNKAELLLLPPLPGYNTTFRKLILNSQSADKSGVQLSVELVMYNAN